MFCVTFLKRNRGTLPDEHRFEQSKLRFCAFLLRRAGAGWLTELITRVVVMNSLRLLFGGHKKDA